MVKTLFLVPRMYTETEFKSLTVSIPDDFKQKASEFWVYINTRLAMFGGRISKIYRDQISKSGEEASILLQSMDSENYKTAKNLVENGASFIDTEDPILVGESESWAEMLKGQLSNTVILELFQKNLEDRARYISNRIDETLKCHEMGVLFVIPDLRTEFGKDFRIIKMCPFDPSDYLNSWRVQRELKLREEG